MVRLENMATADFRKHIENKLQLKKEELAVHNSIKPVPPSADKETVSNELLQKLNAIRAEIKSLEGDVTLKRQSRTTLSIKIEELNRSLQYYENLNEQLEKAKDANHEFVKVLKKYDIDPDSVFTYTVNKQIISDEITNANYEKIRVDRALDVNDEQSIAFKLKSRSNELQDGQDELDKPAKEQQRYLDNLKEWEERKIEIEGSTESEGSIKFLGAQLDYLNNRLHSELDEKYAERNVLIKDLFEKKLSLIKIRKELFLPVTQFITDFKELKERYDVKLDVSLELRAFSENFFSYVNQGRIGTFSGKDEGFRNLKDLVEKSHFDTLDGFMAFSEELIDSLKHDKRTEPHSAIDINNQLRKGVELNDLYDFISHYDYIQPIYSLKLGTKTLEELSPGERGALLLIFYLLLDNNNIPLIIDQPEENLDNESVYHILVHFIKEVKDKRQIVIVTHNPNLAIVCDADQIIHMHIEKDNRNRVKFYSGAIEDSLINETVVNILEGTLPAFNNRDSKYIRTGKSMKYQ
jgi:predicted ATPase